MQPNHLAGTERNIIGPIVVLERYEGQYRTIYYPIRDIDDSDVNDLSSGDGPTGVSLESFTNTTGDDCYKSKSRPKFLSEISPPRPRAGTSTTAAALSIRQVSGIQPSVPPKMPTKARNESLPSNFPLIMAEQEPLPPPELNENTCSPTKGASLCIRLNPFEDEEDTIMQHSIDSFKYPQDRVLGEDTPIRKKGCNLHSARKVLPKVSGPIKYVPHKQLIGEGRINYPRMSKIGVKGTKNVGRRPHRL